MKFPCPICDQPAPALDVVDFNKSCEEAKGKFLPLAGKPIYYHRCDHCGHAFSPEFWDWSDSDFLDHIYNDQYIDIDPDYRDVRPRHNASLLHNLFGTHKSAVRHLDYGGGNGQLTLLLQQSGWDSTSFDPFPHQSMSLDRLGTFNLITAFEVFEHVPDPRELMANISQLMSQECLVLFSTLTSDNALKKHERINWWYCAPRNGHINLFTRQSLALLAAPYQLNFGSLNEGFHCYVNRVPAWASHFVQ